MSCNDEISTKDSEKIVILYEEYRTFMCKEAFRILKDIQLAEDAVQQAFIKIIKNLDKVDMKDAMKTKSFLIIICRNVAFDIYKKRARFMSNSEYIDICGDDDEGELGTFSCPSNVVIENETYSDVIKAIEELPDIYRDVIILEHFHNYSKKEIAKLLNVNYDTVKKRTERGRDLLLEKLEKRGVTLK